MSKIGRTLKDVASQMRPEDYPEVLELFTYLQEHGTHDSDEDEAIDAAQAYLQEVDEQPERPNKMERSIDGLVNYVIRKDVKAVKDILDTLSRKLIYGSGLTSREEEARRIAKEFVVRMQKSGETSSN